MTPRQYCRDKAAPAGSNLYYATLLHDAQSRRRLLALFAFYQELSAAIYRSSDLNASRTTLYWWFEEVGRMRAGNPGHPVTREMAQLDSMVFLSREDAMACVAGMGQFLDGAQGDDCRAWLALHASTAGGIWVAAGRACGCADPRKLALLVDAGCCYGAFEQLHYLRRFAAMGVNPAPVAGRGVDLQAFTLNAPGANLKGLLDELLEHLHKQAQNTHAELRAQPGDKLLFADVLLKLTCILCRKYQSAAMPITCAHRALTPIRKLWVAWRAARG